MIRSSLQNAGIALLLMLLLSCGRQSDKSKTVDYPITPVLFTQVQLHDNFWLPCILKNTEVTIPIAFQRVASIPKFLL